LGPCRAWRAQIAVQSWYLNNLQNSSVRIVWPGRRLLLHAETPQGDLHSKYLALFAFFTLISLQLVGICRNTVPAWMSTLTASAAVFSVVTVIAVLDIRRTRCCGRLPTRDAKFFSVSIFYFALRCWLVRSPCCPASATASADTLFIPAMSIARHRASSAWWRLGGIYHVLPKVADIKWPFAGFIRAHLWLATFGVLLVRVAYLLADWQQGVKLIKPGLFLLMWRNRP